MPPIDLGDRRMTPKFTPDEYLAIAQALRVAALQAEIGAELQPDESAAIGFRTTAVGLRQLAAKAELAATSSA